ncbi:ABC transporter substrate-binding protein [Candidatus Xianfuyuplasma coldseepsis]|uniref:Carbohydrate ABC transporter substrate-binding protein n=1 Tax=Candidatus Xianfuyuplasma coldseepsis TaxID=2782163 RepID=A0A7L7KNX1_9MOLU|nr:ABC transporter substrate-binding protein [Xianfuyuplasma coldseepsis]QMS84225.1 carbohydrate ABC transporter substrate-binding protein [Xianfuyuplasma coldseepsis]
MKKLALVSVAMVLSFILFGCSTDTTPPTISGISEGQTLEVKVGEQVDLGAITATDKDGNELTITIIGFYDINVIDEYDVSLRAKDADGFTISLPIKLSVRAETCEENPDQEICKSDAEKAAEMYEALGKYNVDDNNNDVPDWQEDTIELDMGFSYYGADDATNAVWMNVQKFMEKYPNISVTRNPTFTSGWEDGDDGLLEIQIAASQSGELPEIFFNPKGAETFDKGMTLDLSMYIETDEEAQYITPNALTGMRTYDNSEIWGIPWQGVGPITAINLTLLEELGIYNPTDPDNDNLPGYDWTYEEYEELRDRIAAINEFGQCVFPGVIDFSYFGANYFDSVPNGYRGYNIDTGYFDFAGATNYGNWLQEVAAEAKAGLHWYDLTVMPGGQAILDGLQGCEDITNSWTDGRRGINTIYLWAFNAEVNSMVTKGQEIDIYPYPVAPEGGTTATYTYHDYYSLSKKLEADEDWVRAQAAYELVKWLTYGEEGLESRWGLIDEINEEARDAHELALLDDPELGAFVSPFITGDRYLMDFIQGWPITSNPNVMAIHPLVAGFGENSGGLDRYEFEAFNLPEFQFQMSNANPYPRQIPAFASVANDFEPWDIKDDMRDLSLSWENIAPEIEATLNEDVDKFLQQYSK